ncbi:CBL-interacting serine/threonine-protein kinase 24 isoform X2 [Vigna radiata var. radiata]|uniref:non-specific serine/threonine protein kinase n=1 Tax=Vigna radiata var. radiata TaxID=3916 RepID=A0A1S3UUA5_VIGRR|nr:CBL-interacting serine/threonine-protein kinase 24 isoform X2 [Vigna radiata var. radiata]
MNERRKNMNVRRKIGKYEVGRTIGEGTFAKVKFARNSETGESVAIKTMAKTTILQHRMVEQIKREISIMKIVRHPNIVRLHEVLASQTKIYIILEFVMGGELYDKIVQQGRLSENESRRYFQQLIDAIDHCHKKGVYHRDLKPENLLLDAFGNLKVSDFGLSALTEKGVGLLHTTCGTPNYVAPEVLGNRGYNGAAADVWSCGVILYVLLAGYLPFEEPDLPTLYRRINAAEYVCPFWFSAETKSFIHKILDPNPETRVKIEEIRKVPWFQKNYFPVKLREFEQVNLDDVRAVFDDIEDQYVAEKSEITEGGPFIMNAFEMISLSQGLNLSPLFDRHQDYVKRQTRFVSRKPAKVIISSVEAVAESMGLKVHSRNYKVRLEGASVNKVGQLAVVLEVFEVAPSLFMVDIRKAAGDTFDYHKFYKSFCTKLGSIIWRPAGTIPNSNTLKQMTV